MKYTQGKFIITKKSAVGQNIYSYTISCPEVSSIAVPGQFVHIRAEGHTLRRPISICGIDPGRTIRIVFEIRGEGTAAIARLNEGDLIDMIAPLGKGFTVNDDFKKVILVGGGIGTPPMLSLAEVYGSRAAVICGFRSCNAAILQEDLKKTGAQLILCTDDGSAGVHGFVTDPLAELLEKETPDAVYACGPMPMLRSVAELCGKNVFCEISLEERMACGIGACLGCACRIDRNGEEHFAHVCKDGPVFNAREVIR